MKSKYHFNFEELQIYSKSIDYGELVNKQTKSFPKDERYELTSQFKRAGDSIALNIAEGSGGTDKQFFNYLGNSWHSAHECVACTTKAYLRGYLTWEENEENRMYLAELTKMISSLRNKISNRINNG